MMSVGGRAEARAAPGFQQAREGGGVGVVARGAGWRARCGVLGGRARHRARVGRGPLGLADARASGGAPGARARARGPRSAKRTARASSFDAPASRARASTAAASPSRSAARPAAVW